ncbi:MAG: AAA family ATPase [Deltaproteobacteria bacterium]|nr:AAA family ATPase [Deltaproteobacteria bacterium]
MYYSRFGLSENPFGATPNPRYLYFSRGHREAMDHLIYGIRERKGFIMITGGVGTGKTTLLRSLLSDADDTMKTALILNPFLAEDDLLPAVCAEFGIPAPEDGSRRAWLSALNDFLITTHAGGRTAVLLLDEAQNLSREVLEEARILSNLETDREKLLQIVLTGQEELVHLLARPELRQLNERVVVRYHLGPLDSEDLRAYVQHRMAVAGNRGGVPFSRDAWKALHSVSAGIPRRINAVCDRAFLAAYSRNRDKVNGGLIREAAREVGATGVSSAPAAGWRFSFTLAAALVLALALSFGLGIWARGRTDGQAIPAPSARAAAPALQAPSPSAGALPASPQAASTANESATGAEKPASAPAQKASASWLLNNAQSLDLLYKADSGPQAASKAGLFSFNLDISRARRLKRPFRAALSGMEGTGEGFAVVTGATPTGFSVLSADGSPTAAETADLARYWTGALVWLVPEGLPGAPVQAGSRGPEVTRLQQSLALAGYEVAADGLYGRRTGEAVRRFQADFGISPDGTAGYDTLRVLSKVSGAE